MKSETEKALRVIFKLENKLFSIHSSFVEAMEVIESTRQIPQSPDFLRGIIELRGKVIPLIDLRKVFGMSALKENNEKILNTILDFKDSHEKLQLIFESDISKLEDIDTQDCALKNYIEEFESDNIFFKESISELRYPHQRIHDLLLLALEQKKINKEKYLNYFEQIKQKEFPRFFDKINSTIDILKNKSNEIFIVLGYKDRLMGITVDSIFAVDYVENIDRYKAGIYEFITEDSKDFIETVGRNKKADDLVINLCVTEFFNRYQFDSIEKK